MEVMCFSTAEPEMNSLSAMPELDLAWAMAPSTEHFSFARGWGAEERGGDAGWAVYQLLYHDRVDDRATVDNFTQGPQELIEVCYPVLEQIGKPTAIGSRNLYACSMCDVPCWLSQPGWR